ncbi:hypothetical protein CRE_14445 [Caenorhabditis remanei]|uniref:Serpentine receptor class gamma n=1 Tax=Caenorhabditis remanei TaxID=31234 RepID=E3NUW3_CAERE|nr:hypothetical protein CRE_14445 [Caenorhabditis remanei]
MFSTPPIHQTLGYINIFSSSFSLFFNGFLIYLILTKSPKEFRVYKYLLAFISVFELFYSVLEIVLVPVSDKIQSSLRET